MVNAETTDNSLARRVQDIMTEYVNRKTEEKSGITWDDFKDTVVVDPHSGKRRRKVPDKYREARQSICEQAFLAMRSCHSREDFVTFFTGRIFSVPQFLPRDDYYALSRALLSSDNQWEDVKTLSMLSVSALSEVWG